MTTAAAWLYFAISRLMPRVYEAVKGVMDGLLLGLATRSVLHATDALYYRGEPKYHAGTYNRSGLHDWERSLVREHFPPGGRLVVTAAGGGREVLGLLGMGYDVTAYECNEELCSVARSILAEDGHSPDLVRSAPRDTWVADGTEHDGAIIGWGAYMLIPSRALRVAFLRAAARSLRPGTPLLLSFYDRKGSSRYLRLVVFVGSAIRRLLHRETLTLGDALNPSYVHYFDQEQLAGELAEAGLQLVTYEEGDYGRAVARVGSLRRTPAVR